MYTGPGNRDIRFLGKAITVRSENGPVNCIIDCQGTQQNPHRGFDFDGLETAESVLDGFTITNGSTPPGAILDEFNGAGILFRDGSPTVKNCILTNNWAGCWGGAMCCSWFSDSSPTIINCTIADNYSNAEGGAFFTLDSSPTIIGSLIVNNEAAALGGGITDFGGGTVTIINTTIAGNVAPTASGIYGSNVDISNSIVWGNVGSNQQMWGAVVSYSNVQGGWAGGGAGNIDEDPLFVDPENGDFRLSPNSPSIDAADNTAVPEDITTDLDGNPRFVDDAHTVDTGLGDQPIVDMGPYEFQTTTTTPVDFNAFRGFLLSGTLADVLESDDSDLCYEPGIVLNPTEAPITLDFFGTLPDDSPASLDVTIESSANTVGLELTISFWNYNTNTWDVVGTDTQSLNADAVRTFSGTPADHVEPGTGEVRTRYEVRVVSFIFVFPWLDCVDHVFWSTTN